MYDERTFFTFFALLGFFAFIYLIIAVVLYILATVGLYRLAYNRKIDNSWLVFIPVVNFYILGLIVKKLKFDTFEIPSLEIVLPLGFILVAIIKFIPFIGWLASIAYLFLILFSLYKLYCMYRPQQATLWLILSIVLPFMGPIFIFMMRNDTPVVY